MRFFSKGELDRMHSLTELTESCGVLVSYLSLAISHLTGHVTRLAQDAVHANWASFTFSTLVVVSFVLGAACSSLLIGDS